MKALLFPIMLIAACGLALSFAVHCMSLTGVIALDRKLIWGLGIGVFIVWVPTVILASEMTKHANRKDFWKIALAGCPLWMQRGFKVIFGYAILNFVLFAAATIGQPKVKSETISAAEVRGFSGHLMIFYGVAFMVLYSRIHAPQLYRERKCPKGHSSAPAARFCSECGHDFSREPGDASVSSE